MCQWISIIKPKIDNRQVDNLFFNKLIMKNFYPKDLNEKEKQTEELHSFLIILLIMSNISIEEAIENLKKSNDRVEQFYIKQYIIYKSKK